jgi:hypothetical protein
MLSIPARRTDRAEERVAPDIKQLDSGGSFAFADPEIAVGYAYVMNRMRPPEKADPREWKIRRAFQQAMGGEAKPKPLATADVSTLVSARSS